MSNNFRNFAMPLPKRALRSGSLIVWAAFCTLGFSVSADAKATITTFDAPGLFYTEAMSINATGSIAGWYEPSQGAARRGFVRAPDGTIATFAVPGYSTEANSINDTGVIAGDYQVAGVYHGFVRAADGSITTFDPPGSLHTQALSINGKGSIAGHYGDSSGTDRRNVNLQHSLCAGYR